MVIELHPLPYGYSDLVPHISERTLVTHHAKHHAAYVNNTNNKIVATEMENFTLEQIVRHSALDGPSNMDIALKQDIFNNAAQAYNHQFFWHCMSPSGGGRPSDAVGQRIERDFGSYENFLAVFKDSAVKHFGSGWCWLVWDLDTKQLAVETTSNADTPASGNRKKPLLVVDVWEHAYYLDYTNQRKQFVDIFCEHLINWKTVADRLTDALG